mmetsp:Transcript_76213/g.193398  ORF Transcript_76213/g.193398 Transcript_76213/m.193398 type:complete len:317 (-) Transcript_76213:195-1145(-)
MHTEASTPPGRPCKERRAMSVAPPQRCFAQARSRLGGQGAAACSAAAAFHNSSRRSAGPELPLASVVLLTSKASPLKSAARGRAAGSSDACSKAAKSKSAMSSRNRSTRSPRCSWRCSILFRGASRSTSTQRMPGFSASTAVARPARPQPYSTTTGSPSSRPRSEIIAVSAKFCASCFSACARVPAVATTDRASNSSGSTEGPSTSATARGKAAASRTKKVSCKSSPASEPSTSASSCLPSWSGSACAPLPPLTPFLKKGCRTKISSCRFFEQIFRCCAKRFLYTVWPPSNGQGTLSWSSSSSAGWAPQRSPPGLA